MWWNLVLLSILVLLKIRCSEASETSFTVSADASPEAIKIRELETKLKETNRRLDTLFKSKLKEKTDDALPKNCKDVQERGYNVSTVYVIQPRGAPLPFFVSCDMDTEGGGWTTLLNRFDGSQDFEQLFRNYKNGFGNLLKEFWISLDKVHYLTGFELNELRFELVDGQKIESRALYNFFSIGSENEGYSLKLLGNYTGNTGDFFNFNIDSPFTAVDNGGCARKLRGGWWYKYHSCTKGYFTGRYDHYKGIDWQDDQDTSFYVMQVRMMVRPRDHNNP